MDEACRRIAISGLLILTPALSQWEREEGREGWIAADALIQPLIV